MNLLITNDDGVEAAGLFALFNAAKRFGSPTVVAPKACHSIKSHAVTMNQAIHVERGRNQRFGTHYTCSGTPADCVRLALRHLPIEPVEVVLSGINHGANAGVDVFYSGTVAAAREAVILGRTGIAISQLIRPSRSDNWDLTAELAARALGEVLAHGDQEKSPRFININLPDLQSIDELKGIQRCPLTSEPLDTSFQSPPGGDTTRYETNYTGRYFNRPATPGQDFHYLLDNWITVTPLLIDATDHAAL
ncbi:MAG: 5'/3'-nucleotidase SurE [Planctomycetes bacterium]|nr:5'/3'-nucleotidase SurE [Planctomycetota bacterium]